MVRIVHAKTWCNLSRNHKKLIDSKTYIITLKRVTMLHYFWILAHNGALLLQKKILFTRDPDVACDFIFVAHRSIKIFSCVLMQICERTGGTVEGITFTRIAVATVKCSSFFIKWMVGSNKFYVAKSNYQINISTRERIVFWQKQLFLDYLHCLPENVLQSNKK